MLNVETFVADLHEYLRQAIVPLTKRIADLEGELARQKAVPDALDIAGAVVANAGFDDLIRLQVRDYLAENPVEGERGPPGEKGAAGVGLAGAMINRDGRLLLTLSNGEACDVGPVVGRDAFALEDFEAEFDLDRGLVLRLLADGQRKEVCLYLPLPIHRGYWRDGTRAKPGHLWTHNGSTWIARRDTTQKPAMEYAEDWTLVARKGNDARKTSVPLNGS